MRLEAPIEAHLVDELFEFWVPIFGGPIDVTPEVLLGHEVPKTTITVYVRRLAGKLAGACLVATSKEMPSLGGFGEVATSPDARRSGIATELSHQARDDFGERGGQALFLGTDNADAARIYFRLGWRKLAGVNLMVNVLNGDSPEEFLVDYFRDLGPATVRAPSPADRVPTIPLACVSTRLAGAGLQYRNVVHSLRRAGLLPRPVPPVLGFGRGRTGSVVLRRYQPRAGGWTVDGSARWRWGMPGGRFHAQEPFGVMEGSDSGGDRLGRWHERLLDLGHRFG